MNTKEKKTNNYNNLYNFDYIGTDRKIHLRRSWEYKTICGLKIIKKNPNYKERAIFCSCHECIY